MLRPSGDASARLWHQDAERARRLAHTNAPSDLLQHITDEMRTQSERLLRYLGDLEQWFAVAARHRRMPAVPTRRSLQKTHVALLKDIEAAGEILLARLADARVYHVLHHRARLYGEQERVKVTRCIQERYHYLEVKRATGERISCPAFFDYMEFMHGLLTRASVDDAVLVYYLVPRGVNRLCGWQ